MEETTTTDDYRVRTWPARSLLGRRGWRYQVDYLGAWDADGDQSLGRPRWFADRVTATEAGIDSAIYANGRFGEGVPIRVWLGDGMVEQGTIDRIYMEG